MTDRLLTGDKLTVPVFTDLCSAICWGENIANIHDCPFNGRRYVIMSSDDKLTLKNIFIYRLDGKGGSGSQKVDQALADRFLG